MNEKRRDIVNLDEIETHQVKAGTRFELKLADIDRELGLGNLGAMLHIVPRGKTAWPFHRHHGKDEMFLILSGNGEYRVGGRRLPIRAGDCIGAPAGGKAHQIINSSDGELRYIAFANHAQADVMEYPDSGKIAVVATRGYDYRPEMILDIEGRLTPTTYWEGEDVDIEPETSDG
jgi:uncharacterized cupin superfamily protein